MMNPPPEVIASAPSFTVLFVATFCGVISAGVLYVMAKLRKQGYVPRVDPLPPSALRQFDELGKWEAPK